MEKLRVGVIGVGWYAGEILIPQMRETGRVEVVAISRRDPDRLALAQQHLNVPEAYTDWREMLETSALDAVVVGTPPNAHAAPTIAALQRRLHVFVEKPIALSVSDAQRMMQAASSANRILTVGYNARAMGSWRTISRLLRSGAIGEVRQISVNACADFRFIWKAMNLPDESQNVFDPSTYYGDTFARGNWRTNPEVVGGGMFADVGSHIQDIMLWLGNGYPTEVVAFAQSAGSPSIIQAMARLDNGVTISLCFNDNVSGGEAVTFYSNGSMTFFGDQGMLTADWTKVMSTEAEQIIIEREGVRTQVDVEYETIPVIASFVATVLDGAPNLCPANEAARAAAMTEATYRSLEEKGIVQVPAL